MTSLHDDDDSFDLDKYYAQRRLVAENYFRPALLSSGLDFSRMTALEIGCGRGVKSVVLGGLFDRYIGIDIDKNEVAIAASDLAQAGRTNCEVHCSNFIEALENPARFGMDGEPDFLVLYAVLEHLLPHERREALALAARIVARGGAVFIGETPNRLIPFDSHSSHLHFAQSLPPDLMLRYLARSPHKQWMRSLARLGGELTALHRCGLGLSYHDFELDFADAPNTESMPFSFSGWSSSLVNHQPLQNDEVWLLNYMRDNSLQVHPAFCRNWIEGLLSNRSPTRHRWTQLARLDTQQPASLINRRPFWALDQRNVEFPHGITATFNDTQGVDSYEYILQMDSTFSSGMIQVMADSVTVAELDLNQIKRTRVWAWHQLLVIPLQLQKFYPILTVRPANQNATIGVQALILNGYSSAASSLYQ